MRLALLAILLFSMLLTSACLQRLSSGSHGFTELYRDSLNRLPISSPDDLVECQEGECWCMACTNGTALFPGRQNLVGGHCYIEKDCTPARLSELNNPVATPGIAPLQFMLGQGPTFGDFGLANTYCENRFTMSIQWLLGSEHESYFMPDAKTAMCFLSKGVMPVFVLYSNGTNIDAARAYEMGRVLGTDGRKYYNGLLTTGPVGPVVVVTEMNFDKSKAEQVAEQVRQIERGCGNDRANNKVYCFIAVAPKMNDFEALDAVMDALSADSGMVDLVAYGIDGRHAGSCEGSRVMMEALNFSAYALYNHTKPSIIPYVMFDNNTKSASGCTWTERQVVEAYGSLFPMNIQYLMGRGVIGIAAYMFNSSSASGPTNPLGCASCGAAATTARLNAWYGGCQKYVILNRMGTPQPSDTTQIYFGNTSGTVCNSGADLSYLGGFAFQGKDILSPLHATEVSKANLSYSCDMCLTDNISKPLTEYFSGLKMSRGMQFYKEEYCTAYPEINSWASARSLDPMLIRAIIATESGFNPCAAAKVCAAGYHVSTATAPDGISCFDDDPSTQDECYSLGYDEIYMPESTLGYGTSACPVPVNDGPLGGGQLPKWRWCAFGLMQSLEPPISFWPASHRPDGQPGQYYDVYSRAGIRHSTSMDSARACNPIGFNPFSAADSICVGTAKMERNFIAARQWVNNPNNKRYLNWNVDAETDKTNLFIGYISANKYAGIWDMPGSARVGGVHPRCPTSMTGGECMAYGFFISWQANPGVLLNDAYCQTDGLTDPRCKDGRPRNEPPYYCYGYTDFFDFVEKCEVPFLPYESDRGRVKMEAYMALATECKDSTCPEGKRYFELAEKNVPGSGIPYMPDNLLNPP